MFYQLIIPIFFIVLIIIFIIKFVYRNHDLIHLNIEEATLSYDDLMSHAKNLAKTGEVSINAQTKAVLIKQLSSNYKYIYNTYKKLNEDISDNRRTVPAAEWILDNFYIIGQQIEEIIMTLKKGKFPKLPLLNNGQFAGYPRIYAVILELVSHCDSKIDQDIIIEFINSYQVYKPLTNNELWSINLMCRLAVIESIKLQCEKISQSQSMFARADKIFDQLLKTDLSDEDFEFLLKRQNKVNRSIHAGFYEHLYTLSLGEKEKARNIIDKLDQFLSNYDISYDQISQLFLSQEAAVQITTGNAINSLRSIVTLNFTQIFEKLSLVDDILESDPAGVYSKMDFESKNYYRKQIERIAKKQNISEVSVAKKILKLASQGDSGQKQHVGYYIIKEPIYKRNGKKQSRIYFACALAVSVILSFGLAFYAFICSHNMSLFLLVLLLTLIPSSSIGLKLANYIISKMVHPSFLPKMRFKEGIPEECAAFVIISSLLTGEKKAKEYVKNLERFYLANRYSNLYFAIVADFKDGKEKVDAKDSEIISALDESLSLLNKKYGDLFFAFIRERKLNESENSYMGYERKRGAILEFTQLLADRKTDTSYKTILGNKNEIPKVKYVITLDTDTILPLDVAKNLIATMAHPLNMPVLDERTNTVIDGYAIMQPKIEVSLESSNQSHFAELYGGLGGIDAYSSASFDVYQDLFDEGIFTGKGIFDVEVFHRVLNNTIPDNTVLSHDLLEGSYLRCGLVTDISFIDSYPDKYLAYTARLHRWIRGDWQILPWLFRHVKNKEGKTVGNPLNSISKYKIFDNLRRSLIYPLMAVYVLAAIFVFPGNNLIWFSYAVFIFFFDFILSLISYFLDKSYKFIGQKTYSSVVHGLRADIYMGAVSFITMPHIAYITLDAIIRALYRSKVSKKKMLEWVTAADTNSSSTIRGYYFNMSFTLFFAVVILFLPPLKSILWSIYAIFLIASPYILYRLSFKKHIDHYIPTKEEMNFLRVQARKIWRFFEDIVSDKDNFLPPDNFQEYPPQGIAHRTSPTNIGLYLLSCAAARDFGFIDSKVMLEKIDQTLNTIDRLEKWKGHLYNWYNTRTLALLRPRFISTVDSGNFVAALIVLSQALEEYKHKPVIDREHFSGLLDTILIEKPELYDRIRSLIAKEDFDTSFFSAVDFLKQQDLSGCYMLNQMIGRFNEIKNVDAEADEEIDKEGKFEESVDQTLARIKILIDSTSFEPLYSQKMDMFSIGYNIEEDRLTKSYYDLFASEARQTSYIAIARHEVEKKHWSKLGRNLTEYHGYKGLISWTGTMFEYLMPLILMKSYDNSLTSETYQFVVYAQMKYAKERGVLWGISESGFYSYDINMNYQYKAFGVPVLRLKREDLNDLVISPYSTLLALMVSPKEAIKNLMKLKEKGLSDLYGFYEAIDYTTEHIAENEFAIVKSYMAHHQGMSLLSLDNVVFNNILQRRFLNDPVMNSASELLCEKVPLKTVISNNNVKKAPAVKPQTAEFEEYTKTIESVNTGLPYVHILSNGRYSLYLTDNGLSYSTLDDVMLTRFRSDYLQKEYGTFFFIENLTENYSFFTTAAPNSYHPDNYRVAFLPNTAEYYRKDYNLETTTQVVVSPEDNVEIRVINVKNNSNNEATLDITSYLEPVINSQRDDMAHVAFSNLFIETEFLQETNTLVARRRKQDENKPTYCLFHTQLLLKGENIGGIQFETDRAKFIGRNRSIKDAYALSDNIILSHTQGYVLDPVLSLKCKVKIASQDTIKIAFINGAAQNQEEIFELIQKYRYENAVSRAFELSIIRTKIEHRLLSLNLSEQETFYEIIRHLVFLGEKPAEISGLIANNRMQVNELWSIGISADLPIVSIIINSHLEIELLSLLLKAHEYFRMKRFAFDLVVLTVEDDPYFKPLMQRINNEVKLSNARDLIDKSGGIFILDKNSITEELYNLILVASNIVLNGNGGNVIRQLQSNKPQENTVRAGVIQKNYDPIGLDVPELMYFNQIGGFFKNEYVILRKRGIETPMPWINVISNEKFGFLVSDSGGGYTFAQNSRENKLTRWSNDAISDDLSEAIYIKDNATNQVILPVPNRHNSDADYVIRHGFGYSVFETGVYGIFSRLTEFVPEDKPVKIFLLHLENRTREDRNLSVCQFLLTVLGSEREYSKKYIVSSKDENSQTLYLNNYFNYDFPLKTMFVDSSLPYNDYTTDESEVFLIDDQNGIPTGVYRDHLSKKLGAGFHNCVFTKSSLSLKAGDSIDIVFLLGQESEKAEIKKLTDYFKDPQNALRELENVKAYWQRLLGKIQVETPDASFNYLVNGWLLYQTISCRIFARSGFYQSGGAFGFRDQLQDCASVLGVEPKLLYDQIIRCAQHQFPEGDVLHWWHPLDDEFEKIQSKGVRTKFSDDLLWLVFGVFKYIRYTGDYSILDIKVPYVTGAILESNEDERYGIFNKTEESESIYEHCIKAIEKSLNFGSKGLPKIGTGDWNDGMNQVGDKGEGQSVWLGWFLYYVLDQFLFIVEYKKDEQRLNKYRIVLQELVINIEKNGWDGNWYKRAFYDNGDSIGSIESEEGKIDSISQSWSVISRAGKSDRIVTAMESVEKYLIDYNDGIIKLLTPPFDRTKNNPGYIKGYIPGVRENGGQYTHASCWVILAYIMLGDRERGYRLFSMINPINHSSTLIDVSRYKTEPYVIAADVYSTGTNTGRGGWTWYTGSSGWMYHVAVQGILGIECEGNILKIHPSLPRTWNEITVHYRYLDTDYKIIYDNAENEKKELFLDGERIENDLITLVNDNKPHIIKLKIGNY